MTYTILAQCPQTRRIGIGIATYSLAVGYYCNGMKPNVGASITQAYVRHRNNQLAINMLELGFSPQRVVNGLKSDDPDHVYRQIAVINRNGETAAETGAKCLPWAGHLLEPGAICFGNGLRGQHVVEAIREGFHSIPDDPLEARLLTALEFGRDAGGQGSAERHAPERSAALRVYGQDDFPDTELRVDLHDTAVEELRRVYTTYLPFQGYYRDRDKNPSQAMRQSDFAASLAAKAEG